jgi:hypothetical protein
MAKLFSDRNRPVHMGRFPTEILKRSTQIPDLDGLAPWSDLSFQRPAGSASLVPAMAEFQAMMDAVRDGPQNSSALANSRRPVSSAPITSKPLLILMIFRWWA